MSKTKNNRKITVNEIVITVSRIEEDDYLSLTDMLKAKDGDFFISDWLRNRNTLEFLGVWERINNPNFNCGEFAAIKMNSGLNSFKVSVKELIKRTNAIGLKAKAGRYGGTYAHKDIAFEFGAWLSPEFKLYLIKEFQRLKEQEAQFESVEWQANRELAKINYRLQTDAIQQNLLIDVDDSEHWKHYTSEADMLNMIVFGKTAVQWKQENPNKEGNQRDYGSHLQNAIIANMEMLNSTLIQQGINATERLKILKQQAEQMRRSLENSPTIRRLDKE